MSKHDEIDVVIDKFRQNLEVLFGLIGDHIQHLNKKGKTSLNRTAVRIGYMTISGSVEEIICNFAETANISWKKIDERNPAFFEDHICEIIKGMPETGRETISLALNKEEETENFNHALVFNYFDAFIKLTVKYVILKRGVESVKNDNDMIIYTFKDGFMNHINPSIEIKNRKIKGAVISIA